MPVDAASRARRGDAQALEHELRATRERTLTMLAAWRAQLGDALAVGYDETLNPLRWELGHIGWFEEWWLARNRERMHGDRADPDAARAASIQPEGDRWYDSSRVEHRLRWTLAMPHIDRIVDDVAAQRESSLALLRAQPKDDDSLYFFRLALAHEDMHAEAWLMMAQQLGIAPGDATVATNGVPDGARDDGDALRVEGGDIELGTASPSGFAFDNEVGARRVPQGAFTIDANAVSWRRYLAFVEAGGYDEPRWWSPAGWAWRQARGAANPRYLRRTPDGRWEQQRFDRWIDLDANDAACHLTFHEAQAWCRWAGRALPTEAQWRAAQRRHGAALRQGSGQAFRWGEVWEWTESPFEPFEGFRPHPYRDYSQPWFDGRPVLKGASRWTNPHLHDAAYRNFFLPHRNDVHAGFRSVAPSG
jgi:iron(II)-dependent oxidoreductase